MGSTCTQGGALDFYLEYDRGTETTRQLANKLAGYIGVARDWTEQGAEHFPCVLIVVPNHRRERVVAAAFADGLARFKRAAKLAGLKHSLKRSIGANPGMPLRQVLAQMEARSETRFELLPCEDGPGEVDQRIVDPLLNRPRDAVFRVHPEHRRRCKMAWRHEGSAYCAEWTLRNGVHQDNSLANDGVNRSNGVESPR